jgi:hypothetical protein
MSTTLRVFRRGLAALAATAVLIGADGALNAQSGGPREGIKVIGEWTIVVRDEAGRVVQRSDFHNALTPGQGNRSLASLLSRGQQLGQWAIMLTNGSFGPQPCGTATAGKPCGLAEQITSQVPFQDTVAFVEGLTVGIDPADATKMRLAGSMKATNAGVVTTVSAMVGLCPPGPPSPTGCATTQTYSYFSGTANFTNPPTVSAGQTIDVTVTYSFQ